MGLLKGYCGILPDSDQVIDTISLYGNFMREN